MMASVAASSDSKTRAGPVCCRISGATTACLTTAPSGARLPKRMASPPRGRVGRIEGTDDRIVAHLRPPAQVLGHGAARSPSAPRHPAGRRPAGGASRPGCRLRGPGPRCDARRPPGSCGTDVGCARCSSFRSGRGISTPASWAMASRCSTELVEPPSAMSTAKALRKAAGVRMSRGLMSRARSSMICIPAAWPAPAASA